MVLQTFTLLMKLSPIRKGRDFCDGVATDSQKKLHLVGFDYHIQEKLIEHHRKGEAVLFKNCTIKAG